GKKGWQRVKWSDSMVRLLITAVSYISEEAGGEDHAHRRKMLSLHKKGKWKSVSKVMAERGHFVSPQQCEDKFNDLNKRYKRLNEILGRGTSCEVVENPSLLDMMDHVSNKEKEEVRKILSSKHLYYEEMCSYHNGNRLHLPPDPDLHHSLRLALMLTDDNDTKSSHEDAAADHDSEDLEDFIGSEQNKRAKKSSQDFSFRNSSISLAPNQNNDACEGGGKRTQTSSRVTVSLQLEEQRFHIQEQMLELENERLKWQQLCQKQDRELEMMKLENQRMKMENEQMALELKRKELGMD
ncbi:hypothetical protein M569_04922, partial [Genlisea aurea]